MFPIQHRSRRASGRAAIILGILLAVLAAGLLTLAPAWTPPQPLPAQPQAQQPPAEAGGPQTEVGPIAVPKKKEEPPPEKPRPPKTPPGMPEFSLRKDVPLVSLDVMVTTKDGQFIPGLKKENFHILEDGVPQKVSTFSQTEAPITAVLLVEFASNNYYFMYDAVNASYAFAQSLRPNDWVAVVCYDMKPHMLVDFTQDKQQVYGALRLLRIPGFRETNLFDALYDTLDRLERVEGRKYIILVSTGVDTFSHLTLDHALKKVKSTPNVTIFTIGTGQALREWADARGYMGSITRLDYLQADNQMSTFARMTGGRSYFPRFEAQFREIFADVGNAIRNQYNLVYYPTNTRQDGTWRKIKVEVVAPDGGPMHVRDQKGKEVKYQVIAREGYNARQEVE